MPSRPYESLRGRREFTLALRRGIAVAGDDITLHRFSPRGDGLQRPKVGIIIGRAVGTAVARNRLRRRCRAILDAASFVGDVRWYVITCRPKAASLSFAELRTQLLSTLHSAREAKAPAARARPRQRRQSAQKG